MVRDVMLNKGAGNQNLSNVALSVRFLKIDLSRQDLKVIARLYKIKSFQSALSAEKGYEGFGYVRVRYSRSDSAAASVPFKVQKLLPLLPKHIITGWYAQDVNAEEKQIQYSEVQLVARIVGELKTFDVREFMLEQYLIQLNNPRAKKDSLERVAGTAEYLGDPGKWQKVN
jgi:hypothetical protein